METIVPAVIRVADEVWIATALLHRENPGRSDFAVQEIIDRAAKEAINGPLRKGASVHVYLHCVANMKPNPGQLRMLFATGRSTRRLYREGDRTHPDRHGRITPDADALPATYRSLLDWYTNEYAAGHNRWLGGLFEMAGAGRAVFGKTDPDEYVRRLREKWG